MGRGWRTACATILALAGTACLPGGWIFDDACAMRPVSGRRPVLAFLSAPVVVASTCGALVEVNGDAQYVVGGPDGFVVDHSDLTPFGAVTATNGHDKSGEVFALDGVDPAKLLALRDPTIGGTPIPLYGTEGDAPGGAAQAFPEACPYFPTRTDRRCE